jgi:hypothetical protein
MIRDRNKITGKVTVTVFGPDGQIKRREPNWLQKLLGFPGNRMVSVNHNIVTDQGDALVADLMCHTTARQKVDNTNGRMTVGTGWTGTTPKTNTACNTPSGSAEVMDATYPKIKGAFGAANDNVTQYRSTFEAGDLNVTGIDEVALHNTTVDNLAYAQVTPTVDVATTDTLQVDWEITFLGA